MPQINTLYLAVIPIISLDGKTADQFLTLVNEESAATAFSVDDVGKYEQAFEVAAKLFLTGGEVVGYWVTQWPTEDGRVVVKVEQRMVSPNPQSD